MFVTWWWLSVAFAAGFTVALGLVVCAVLMAANEIEKR